MYLKRNFIGILNLFLTGSIVMIIFSFLGFAAMGQEETQRGIFKEGQYELKKGRNTVWTLKYSMHERKLHLCLINFAETPEGIIGITVMPGSSNTDGLPSEIDWDLKSEGYFHKEFKITKLPNGIRVIGLNNAWDLEWVGEVNRNSEEKKHKDPSYTKDLTLVPNHDKTREFKEGTYTGRLNDGNHSKWTLKYSEDLRELYLRMLSKTKKAMVDRNGSKKVILDKKGGTVKPKFPGSIDWDYRHDMYYNPEYKIKKTPNGIQVIGRDEELNLKWVEEE